MDISRLNELELCAAFAAAVATFCKPCAGDKLEFDAPKDHQAFIIATELVRRLNAILTALHEHFVRVSAPQYACIKAE